MTGAAAPQAARVPVRAPDGTLGTVPQADLDAALQGGATLADPAELRAIEDAARREEQYGGLSGAAAAGGLGALRGATFGLSDVVATGLGGDPVRETLAGYKETNPSASLAGEVVGAIAPVVASGGSGAVARGVSGIGAISRGSAALGGLAERGVARLVGEGAASLAGRVAQRALPLAAQGAVEGALYETGMQLSEDTLGDHEVTAEKLLAAAKKGALFGGAAGAGLGTVGELLGTGARSLSEYAGKKLAEDGGLAGLLRGMAEDQALRATGAKMADLKKLGKTAAEVQSEARGIGRTLLDERIVTAGDDLESISGKVLKRADEVGKELGDLVKGLDKAPAKFDTVAATRRVFDEVVNPLQEMPLRKAEAAKVWEYWRDFTEKAGKTPSFEKVRDFRIDLDKRLRTAFDKPQETAHDALKQVRGIIEDEFEKAAERASTQLGDSVAQRYQALKATYADLAKVRDITTRETVRDLSNRAVSLTDTIAGIGGFATMGPKGLLLAGANKLVRERANQVAADVLNRVSQVEAVRRLSAKVDGQIGSSVRGLLEKGERAATTGVVYGLLPAQDTTRGKILAVRQLAANPAQMTDRIGRLVAPVQAEAPKTAGALAQKATQAVAFLAQKAPVPRTGQSLIPQHQTPRFSDAEVARFARYLKAVEDPASVLDDVRDMKVSRESVEAVKAVYPRLFQQMQGDVMKEIGRLEARGELEARLPWEKRKQLSILLGVPADETLTPAFIKAMQATKPLPPQEGEPAPEQQPTQQPQGGGRRPADLSADEVRPFSETIGGMT